MQRQSDGFESWERGCIGDAGIVTLTDASEAIGVPPTLSPAPDADAGNVPSRGSNDHAAMTQECDNVTGFGGLSERMYENEWVPCGEFGKRPKSEQP